MRTAARKPPLLRMALADFLDWPGDGSAKRYELVDGAVRAMSPASATHGIIQARLAYLIERCLIETGSPCRVVTEGAVVPRLRAEDNLRVPDLVVTCSGNAPGQIVVPDPVLLIEVLSPTNESDTRENVWAYATLPTVREIVLVHSTRIRAELLRRAADASWPEKAQMLGREDRLDLESIGLSCPLSEIYARTHLA